MNARCESVLHKGFVARVAMTNDLGNVKRCMHLQLYQSFKIYIRCAQLLCIAPYNIGQESSSVTYFKQARFLVTLSTLAWIAICGYQVITRFIEVPMPFFTGVLYVNEAVMCIFISILSMSIGYTETQRCNQFIDKILIIASTLPCTEWIEILAYVRLKLLWLCTVLITMYGLALCFDFLHYGSIFATLFSLGAYLLPTIFASMSLAQYYVGTVLIYKLQQKINQLLCTGKSSIGLKEAKHFYLQLNGCVELITRSFEILIVTNVLTGINAISLQVLEIYQHLHVGATKPIYMAYNVLWILLQLCMLLMVLYPNEMIKREQTRFGTILFELSHQNETEMADVQMTRLELLTLDRKKIVTTACGVLRLEISSLSSIFVALLSFMVILIQFDSAKISKNNGAVTAIDSVYKLNS